MPESDLHSRLQAALGESYRLEKELGGGGMSRVFLAEEAELGRRVVIKVLPPEMAADVNQERFQREIQLAARLQHPHVVSMLTAGSAGDLLYYVMPYIKGESLRAKLQREGELPVGEAMRILKEIVDALAYAHREGVVHRDIKPDNVLLSEGHAVVTDFGVAKAVTASSGSSSLTSLGVALGTPAYMAPEQAAADPHTDHRADIYAVGALAYEMLTGRPPFVGATPQEVMAAHVSRPVEPVSSRRPAVGEAVSGVVMRCLEKRAADRWQSAAELVPQLEALATPSGGVTPTGTQPVAAVAYQDAARRGHPARVTLLFLVASLAVLAAVYAVTMALGLPVWVFAGAGVLLAVGLPIMLMTGLLERRRAMAAATGMHLATPTGVHRHFTWKRSLLGGGVAFVGLGVVAVSYMAMRAFGIGPAATLVATGVLEEQDRLIVADFENRAADSTLGPTVTELFRIDLAQSPLIRMVEAAEIAPVLRRMNRDPGLPMDLNAAREVAEREGIKAIVTGEVAPLGQGYVLSARLVSVADGQTLVPARETAAEDADIINAVDRLSAKLRERIGESLKTIRANEPLRDVTTASLEALRIYTVGWRVFEREGDYEGAIPFFEEAVALDSGFAMAHRKLGVSLSNMEVEPTRVIEALTEAYRHRNRLPDRERYLTEGTYFATVEGDVERAITAYETLLEVFPNEYAALNNLGNLRAYTRLRDWVSAEALYARAVEAAPWARIPYTHLTAMQVNLGRPDSADRVLDNIAGRFAGAYWVSETRAYVAYARGDYAAAEGFLRELRELMRGSPRYQSFTSFGFAELAALEGKLGEARTHYRDAMRTQAERGLPAQYLEAAAALGTLELRLAGRADQARQIVRDAEERFPLETIPADDRPYVALIMFYAAADRPERAAALLGEYGSVVREGRRRSEPRRYAAAGAVALAEGRLPEAVEQFRLWDEETGCPICALPALARAYDLMGVPDSTAAIYQRYLGTPAMWSKLTIDAEYLAPAHKRLGELFEARGEPAKAVEHYDAFVALWQGAGPELQPEVADVRARLARLVGEG